MKNTKTDLFEIKQHYADDEFYNSIIEKLISIIDEFKVKTREDEEKINSINSQSKKIQYIDNFFTVLWIGITIGFALILMTSVLSKEFYKFIDESLIAINVMKGMLVIFIIAFVISMILKIIDDKIYWKKRHIEELVNDKREILLEEVTYDEIFYVNRLLKQKNEIENTFKNSNNKKTDRISYKEISLKNYSVDCFADLISIKKCISYVVYDDQ